jgi:thiamine biosynthesis lipoprotein
MSAARARAWWLPAALLALAGCGPAPEAYTERFLAMGTWVEVSLYGVEADEAQALVDDLEADFAYAAQAWRAWGPNVLGRVNAQLPLGERLSTAPPMAEMIAESKRLALVSEELFNPAIGQLVALWGFQSELPPEGPPPSVDEIEALVFSAPSMREVEIDGVLLRGENPVLRIDLGGFAKGYAVDLAIERLRERGAANAIVNAGGDLRAIGRHGERPWRIGIRHPRADGVIAALEIEGDEGVFTSGDYERYYEWAGQRYHHILDPRTGYPASGTVSVTVIHARGAVADAAATALFVAGAEDWPRIARSLGVEQVLRVGADGVIEATPAMAARIELLPDPAPELRIRALAP